MLSKNKNKLLIFEEEYDQSKKNINNIRSIKPKNETFLLDSLDIKQASIDKNIIIFRLSDEDYLINKENCGVLLNYLKEIKSLLDSKVFNLIYI